MRNNLEIIQKVEDYILCKLSEEDKLNFEKEIDTNPELAKQLEAQQLLIQAVNRKALRKDITKASRKGGNGYGKWIAGGVIALLLALTAYYFNGSKGATPSNVESTEQEDSTFYGLHTFIKPKVQNFTFDSDTGATIEGEDGILVIVPNNAFVDKKGNPIQGTVEFELVEAITLDDMVLYNLTTMNNDKVLETGGMFFVNAKVNGQEVDLNPEAPLYVEIPTDNRKSGMMAWDGEIQSDGSINWVNQQPLTKYLAYVDMNQLDFLPTGFETEVRAQPKGTKYFASEKKKIDNIYYSLTNVVTNLARPQALPAPGRLEMDEKLMYWTQPEETNNLLDDMVSDSALVDKITCGINPSSIHWMVNGDLGRTYLSTKEFEERVQALHKLDEGDQLFQMYVKNIDQPMWKTDEAVANMLKGENKAVFQRFAEQKCTTVKDAKKYGDRLSKYYNSKIKERNKAVNDLRNKLSAKDANQIASMQKKVQDLMYQAPRRGITPVFVAEAEEVVQEIAPMPKRSVATQDSYSMAVKSLRTWTNCDRFSTLRKYIAEDSGSEFKDLKYVKCLKDTNHLYAKYMQWTYHRSLMDMMFADKFSSIGIFPSEKKKFKKRAQNEAYIIGIDNNDGKIAFGVKEFDPYSVEEVNLDLKPSSYESIQAILSSKTTAIEGIVQKLKDQNAQMEKLKQERLKRVEIQRERRAERAKRRAEAERIRKAALKEAQLQLAEEIATQRSEQIALNKLRMICFPCEEEIIFPVDEIEVVEDPEKQTEELEAVPIEDNTSEFFTIVEDMPEFLGGEMQMMQFISKNMNYPSVAIDSNIQGTVIVQFIVDSDGTASDVTVIRGIGGGCDEAAVAVIEAMPPWKPGKQRGKAVPVMLRIPLRFYLR